MFQSSVEHPKYQNIEPGIIIADHFNETDTYFTKRPQGMKDWSLTYTLGGQGYFTVRNKTIYCNPNQVVLLRPGIPHQYGATQSPEDRLTVIYHHFSLTHSRTDQAFHSEELPPRMTQVQDSFVFEQHLNQLLDILDRKDIWIEEEFHSLMKHILLLLYKAHASRQEWSEAKLRGQKIIQGVMNYVRDRIDKRIDYNELAEAFALNSRYISHIFKLNTGYSLKENITRLRLERAVTLLTETPLSISEIADTLGFTDIYHFSKLFKAHYGVPPSAYRYHLKPSKPHS